MSSLLLQLAGLSIAVFTAALIDRVIPSAEHELLPLLLFFALLIVLAQATISYLRERLILYLKAHVDVRAASGFVDHLLRLPLAFFERRGSGDLIGRVAGHSTVREALSTPVLGAVLDGAFVLGYLMILFYLDTTFAIAAVILGGLQAAGIFLLTRPFEARLRYELLARAESFDYLAHVLGGIATIKASGGEDGALAHWSPLLNSEIRATIAVGRQQALITSAMAAMRLLFPIVLLMLGSYGVMNGRLTLGEAFALIAIATAFLAPISSLVSHFQQLQRASAHLDRIVDVLNSEAEQERSRSLRRRPLAGRIELRNVSFAYDHGSPLALQSVSIRVEAGTKLAIVGRTGSGKSTLARLLLGLYVPTHGEVLYDGIPIPHCDLRSLRSQFGVVLQDAQLFPGSIRDNIGFHRPGLPHEAIMEVARAAEIHDDIAEMPLGYDTPIMQAGAGLSGGQRQRIALAQALARRPAILLLDEATSHLDAITEQRIDAHVSNLSCTRIVIAHRLSTIRNADHIVVLDGGRVVEEGTHTELVARAGHYLELMRMQVEEAPVPDPLSLNLPSFAAEATPPTKSDASTADARLTNALTIKG